MSKEQPAVTMTPDQLQAILTGAIKAAKEPSDEEQLKQMEATERRSKALKNRQQLAIMNERSVKMRQDRCDHKKPNGELAIGGQAMSNGRQVKICLRCQKEVVNQPTREMGIAQEQVQRLINEGKIKVENGKVVA